MVKQEIANLFPLLVCLSLALPSLDAHMAQPASYDAPRYFITSPNAYRLGRDHTVSVIITGVAPQRIPLNVTVKLQDYPHRQRTFSEKEILVSGQGSPYTTNVKVRYEDLPISVYEKSYVYLVVSSNSPALSFKQEALVLVLFHVGHILMETDKPLYNPRQTVLIRMVAVDEDLQPRTDPIRLDILNPQGVIINRKDDLTSTTGFITTNFTFPSFPMFGNWTAVASFGQQYRYNTTATFLVKEYILPIFAVEIQLPGYILPQREDIRGEVRATYVFGEMVDGMVDLKFGIKRPKQDVNIFVTMPGQRLANGRFDFRINLDRYRLSDNNFPQGARLYVEAKVTERVGGRIEVARELGTHFTYSPYKLRVEKSPAHFKPGLPYFAKVYIRP